MADTPIAMSSRIPALDRAYKKAGTLTPASCVDLSRKIANIQRQIQALEDYTTEMQSSIRTQQRLNKGLLLATVVRDTCVAFLDLAAALAPGKTGEWTAKLGNAAISTASSVGEIAAGQGDALTIGQRTFDTAAGLVPGNSAGAIMGVAKAQQASSIATLIKASGESDATTREREVIKTSTIMMLDNAISTVDLAKLGREAPGLDKVGKGLSMVKASANYGFNLRSAQDAYFNEDYALMQRKFDVDFNYTQGLKKLGKQLTEALAVFEECKGLEMAQQR